MEESEEWAVLLEGSLERVQEIRGVLGKADVEARILPPPPEKASA